MYLYSVAIAISQNKILWLFFFLISLLYYMFCVLYSLIMDSVGHPSDSNNKIFNIEDLNIEILPVIYEIIRSIEKDNHHDNAVKTRDSQDCSQKVLELQKRLDQARAEIRMLPGIDYSKEQQLNHLEALKTQLRLKQELLQKYRYMYPFDIQKQ